MKPAPPFCNLFLYVLGSIAACAQVPEQQFAKICAGCHGEGATGTDRGPSFINSRSLRRRSQGQIQDLIRKGTPGGMPAFPLPEDELTAMAAWVHSFNASAFEVKPAGDQAAGEAFFFDKGQCATCHMVRGHGKTNGPDL